ncbi:unnamed protein product [Bursaphelenchus okinawaensis]|uniref:Cytoplasmic tRNA 2-thiolation protein 2 n=1 Tax=Bursaphelenchus okinawaensis TaxID=465554 RepID=A0A811LIK2_9BILA|nr:unnamed protein product [Bursaphelenchus okinawaensis]CAG9126620.1 unnamed protein product [Bursaphelenchus okinawaensis]
MSRLCIKCKKPGEYCSLETTKVLFCGDCYLESIKQKFRSAVSKSKLFKRQGTTNILVVGFNDVRTSALLKLIDESYDERKAGFLSPKVYYVDFSGNEGSQTLDKVDGVNIVKVSAVLNEFSGDSNAASYANLKRYLPDNASLKDEVDRLMFDYFIYHLAEKLGVNIVFTSENAELIAQKTLNVTCMGRAEMIPFVTDVLDDRHSSISIVRPLRNITNTEIAFLTGKLPSTDYGSSVSSKFLENLVSQGYPGTVSTVLSVANKIQVKTEEEEDKRSSECWLCKQRSNSDQCQGCSSFISQIPQRDLFLKAFNRGIKQ